jgi:hypothetical protein
VVFFQAPEDETGTFHRLSKSICNEKAESAKVKTDEFM